MLETKFYEILNKAKDNETSLIIVINKIMPLINKLSLNEDKKVDDDLRNILIEYAIKTIKSDDFAEKFLNNEKF